MVLYGITLVTLAEEPRDAGTTILSPSYPDNSAFDGLVRQSAAQPKLHMYRGPDRGCFPDPDKSLFIADNPEDKEVVRWEFDQSGLNLHYLGGS